MQANKHMLTSAVSVQWVNENSCLLQVDEARPDQALNQQEQGAQLLAANMLIQSWTSALVSHSPSWLEQYVPSYTSLLIVYDLHIADKFLVLAFLKTLAQKMSKSGPTSNDLTPTHHTIPVCYDCDLTLKATKTNATAVELPNDMELLTKRLDLSSERIIALHTSPLYRVFTVGFLPNFAYMGLTDSALNVPRLPSPRKRVPPGAVAIADNQTAIYPQTSPGGWHILGYTPVALDQGATLQFKASDTVSFYAICVENYLSEAKLC